MQEIETRTSRTISSGALYTALDRLEARGFVQSRLGEPTAARGGKRKRLYTIEPAGARALTRSYDALQKMASGMTARLQASCPDVLAMIADPPRLAVWLLRLLLPPDRYETIAGDLEERFRLDVQPLAGARIARRWYWRQSLSIAAARLLARSVPSLAHSSSDRCSHAGHTTGRPLRHSHARQGAGLHPDCRRRRSRWASAPTRRSSRSSTGCC